MFVYVARGAQVAAREAGMNMLLANADNDGEQQDESLTSSTARASPACCSRRCTIRGHHRAAPPARRPVVVLNYHPNRTASCSVSTTTAAFGYLATRHMIDLADTPLLRRRDNLHPCTSAADVLRAVAESSGRVRLEEIPTFTYLNPPLSARRRARSSPD